MIIHEPAYVELGLPVSVLKLEAVLVVACVRVADHHVNVLANRGSHELVEPVVVGVVHLPIQAIYLKSGGVEFRLFLNLDFQCNRENTTSDTGLITTNLVVSNGSLCSFLLVTSFVICATSTCTTQEKHFFA